VCAGRGRMCGRLRVGRPAAPVVDWPKVADESSCSSRRACPARRRLAGLYSDSPSSASRDPLARRVALRGAVVVVAGHPRAAIRTSVRSRPWPGAVALSCALPSFLANLPDRQRGLLTRSRCSFAPEQSAPCRSQTASWTGARPCAAAVDESSVAQRPAGTPPGLGNYASEPARKEVEPGAAAAARAPLL